MNKRQKITCLMVVVGCLFLVGCHPKRIAWSPDGQWAAYCNDVGLYFVDGQGNISDKMLEHVYRAEWFPDSKRLAIEQFAELTTWKQVEDTVTEEHRQKYLKYAEGLLAVKNKKEWDEKTDVLQSMNLLDEDELKAVQLYIRDVASSGFPKDILQSWESYIEFNYQSLRIGTWDGREFLAGQPLWTSPQRIWDMRISGKGQTVVFTAAFPGDFEEGTASSLWITDVTTGNTVKLDKNVSLYPDWDAAGTTLYYVRSIGKESTDNPLGTLLKRQLCDDNGKLLADLPQPESLAGLVANEFTKLRCLSDGRIIFSSMEVTLPVIGKDIPEQKQLFVLDPQRQSVITRLIPRSEQTKALGYNFDFFEVSPDESVISIPDDDGRVAALTIATGEMTILDPDGTDEIKTVPVWRSPDQLCYVDEVKGGLLGDKVRKQMMLRQVAPGGEWAVPQAISKNWPKEARKNILD
ncbi:MAG: hypothetical protein ACYSUT_11170 [Planctomycetota bacterium]